MPNPAYALLLLTTLIWGGNTVAGKLAAEHISPFLLTGLRWVLGLAVVVPFAWPHLRREWPQVRKNLPALFFLGALGFTAFNAALYTALNYTSAVNVAIEQAAIPMVIIVLNFVLFHIRVTWLQVAGFLISLLGVAFTASHGDLSRLTRLDFGFGDFLMLLAVLFYGIYTVFLRFKPDIHWLSTIAVLAVSASITSLPLIFWEYASGRIIFPDARGWAVTAYAAIFPSLLAQVLYIRGIDLIGGNRAGLFVNLVPVFGTLLSVVLLGEAFHGYHALAMALVFCGIGMAEYSGRKAAIQTARIRAPID